MRNICQFFIIFCFAGCAWVNNSFSTEINPGLRDTGVKGKIITYDELIDRGRELYDKQCASCHGTEGRGDGVGAYLLKPHPRDFSLGKFRLVTTVNKVPSDEDLYKTISQGMPGSSMPPWEHLIERDRMALVYYVRYLAKEGKIKNLMAKSKKRTRKKAEATAIRKLTPSDKIKLPAKTPPSIESIALGRRLYVAKCASCHGINGDGDSQDELKDEEGFPIMPRDFTAGVFKGGAQPDDIAYRIMAGIPSTPMPSFEELKPSELWSLVYYVRSLANPTSQALSQQKKLDVIVKKVEAELSADMDKSVWDNAIPSYLSLLPLWWRKDLTKGVYAQAIHNNGKIAVRMIWEDATRNDNVLDHTAFSDGAAVQFSSSNDPPFFAMGYEQDPVNIWNWKAWREPDALAKYQTVKDVQPNMPDDQYPSAGYIGARALFATASDVGNPTALIKPASSIEDLNAGGFGTLTNQGDGSQNVAGYGKWADGFWEVLFVRDIKSEFNGDIAFEPGSKISAAFALWDGEYQDRNGQKSVTIWHNFVIE